MARALGRGGKSAVANASGLSRNTVIKAQSEVESGIAPSDRLRAPGAGDKAAIDKQPGLAEALDELVHPGTRGTPMSALRWTLKSTYELARDLQADGFRASAELVRRLLHDLGYSLQAPAKQNEGTAHPDRDGQFGHINALAAERLAAAEPVISVDTKKKELIGSYANGGREWQPSGEPQRVNVHDFADRALGEFAKAIPYGVYDVGNDEGWVSVGDTADTAEFAVESIRRWWNTLGTTRFPNATRLLITADAGGSNGYRVRAWKWHLAQLAADTGLEITVCHYPPGTSKWNKIEHRLFSFISMNWRGRPLTDIRTIVELIAATTTQTGLTVQAAYDPDWYATGVKISNEQLAAIPLTPHEWHGEWNYTIAQSNPR
ncbi:MAG: ISAzo13 family transposase [Nocardioidaceae bacterium]